MYCFDDMIRQLGAGFAKLAASMIILAVGKEHYMVQDPEQQPSKPRRTFITIGILLVTSVLVWLFQGAYTADWTGFREKTLWDWLQLLIVPIVLSAGAYFFSRAEKRNEQRIADDNQREAALQAYLDRMTELLLDRGLRTSQPDDDVRMVARAQTLTVLQRLDPDRKARVVRFLYEANLLWEKQPVIKLDGADLTKANLSGVILLRADLQKANLQAANLQESYLLGTSLLSADLRFANLMGANLEEAVLAGARLEGANLHKAWLERANLHGADFRGTKLTQTHMWGANLGFANLTGVNLEGVTLESASLEGAFLDKASLTNANLTKANLYGVNMPEATLINTNLTDANLRSTDLTKANLTGAVVTQAQLSQCYSLKGAILPDGTKIPDDQDFPPGWK